MKIATFVLNALFRVAALNIVLLAASALIFKHGPLRTVAYFSIIPIDIAFLYFWGKWQYGNYMGKNTDEKTSKTRPTSWKTLFLLPCASASWFLLWLINPNVALSIGAFGIFAVLAVATSAYLVFREKNKYLAFFCMAAGLFVLFCAFFALAFIGAKADYVCGTSWYNSGKFIKYFVDIHPTSRELPENATNIRVRGRSGFTTSYNWTAQVSEADFLKFAAKYGYTLSDNTYFNANPETQDQVFDAFSIIRDLGGPDAPISKPDSFYFYNYRYRNHGGLTLLYDRTTQTLYGNYANR